MTKRLVVLLGVFASVSAAAVAYWLWPGSGPLPAGALRPGVETLYVVRVEPVTDGSVEALVATVAPFVPIEVRQAPEWTLDLRHTLGDAEDLYDASRLVKQLDATTTPGSHVLGITDQTIRDDEHYWLFGKAQLGGRTAVVSTAHMWADGAEGDAKQQLFRARLARVGVHEFAHTLGFLHCDDRRCVMKESMNLTMLDRTRPTFCRMCLQQ